MLLKSNRKGSLQNQGLISLVFSEVAEIARARLGQFYQLLKTREIFTILNFTHPYAISYTNILKLIIAPWDNNKKTPETLN